MSGNANVGIGYGALGANTSGFWNTASGMFTLAHSTTGSENTATGQYALFSNVDGVQNTAMGSGALQFNTGTWNTAVGSYVLADTRRKATTRPLGITLVLLNAQDGHLGGTVLDFVAIMERCSIREAALHLRDWFGEIHGARAVKSLKSSHAEPDRPLPFHLHGVDHTHPYLEERSVSASTAR